MDARSRHKSFTGKEERDNCDNLRLASIIIRISMASVKSETKSSEPAKIKKRKRIK